MIPATAKRVPPVPWYRIALEGGLAVVGVCGLFQPRKPRCEGSFRGVAALKAGQRASWPALRSPGPGVAGSHGVSPLDPGTDSKPGASSSLRSLPSAGGAGGAIEPGSASFRSWKKQYNPEHGTQTEGPTLLRLLHVTSHQIRGPRSPLGSGLAVNVVVIDVHAATDSKRRDPKEAKAVISAVARR